MVAWTLAITYGMLCLGVSAVPSPSEFISDPLTAADLSKVSSPVDDNDMSRSESKLFWWWWGDKDDLSKKSKDADDLYKKKWEKYRHDDNYGWGKPWWWWKKDW